MKNICQGILSTKKLFPVLYASQGEMQYWLFAKVASSWAIDSILLAVLIIVFVAAVLK